MILMLLTGLLSPSLRAEKLTDPTRPPGVQTPHAISPEGFVPPGQGAASNAALRVSAIILKPKGSYAIINGETVKVGDTVEGYDVVAIERGRVTMSHGGEPIEVGLSTSTQSGN